MQQALDKMATREEHFNQALEHFARGQLDAAIAAYRSALELDPNYTDALHGLAEALARTGDLDTDIEVARRITEIDPDDVLARTSLSRFYQRKGMKRKKYAEEAATAEPGADFAPEVLPEVSGEAAPETQAIPGERQTVLEPVSMGALGEEALAEAAEAPPLPAGAAPAQGSLLARWWRRLFPSKPPEIEPAASPESIEMPQEPYTQTPALEVAEAAEREPLPEPIALAEVLPAPPAVEAVGEEELSRLSAEVSQLRSTQEDVSEQSQRWRAEVARLTRQLEEKSEDLERAQVDLDATRSQGRREMEAAGARLKDLQAVLDESHRDAAAARARLREQESRIQELEFELTGRKQPTAELEERLAQLSQQLAAKEDELRQRAALVDDLQAKLNQLTRQLAAKEEEFSTVRRRSELVDDLEAKLERLSRELAAKEAGLNTVRSRADNELAQARQEATRARGQVRDLEAALAQATDRATQIQAEVMGLKAQIDRLELAKAKAPAATKAAPAALPAPSQAAADFYQQALSPLTVLTASADLLVMDPKLDASVRETAQDIKTQIAALLELIKKFTRLGSPGTK